MTKPTLFHVLSYADVDAGIAFLTALGFTEQTISRDPENPAVVVHAQFGWGDAGGIMFGSQRDDPHHSSVGEARCYCVVATDVEVDQVHAKALADGGASLREPVDQDYGGRGCTVTDPEGNQWSFGSYPGE